MRRPSWLSPAVILTAGLVSVVVLGYGQYRLWREIRQLHQSLNYAEWLAYLEPHESQRNHVQLDVGVIQFLDGGYSMMLDSVSYEPAGVRLVGQVGNPNLIRVSSLTLNLTVNRPLRTFGDEYMSNPAAALRERLSRGRTTRTVGTGQVLVGTLDPGESVPFKVVIPNVKQDAQGYEVEVAFSGERYSYLR